jgi:hypothetical protein
VADCTADCLTWPLLDAVVNVGWFDHSIDAVPGGYRPHLHLEVWSWVPARRGRLPIDPFGWWADSEDPWSSHVGASTWLWNVPSDELCPALGIECHPG